MAKYHKVVNNEVVEYKTMDEDFFNNEFVDTTPGEWIKVEGDMFGVGLIYHDGEFKPKSPFASWSWDSVSTQWVAPTAYPTDGERYSWDEETTSWTQLDPQ